VGDDKSQTVIRFKVLAGSFWDHKARVDYNRGDEVRSTLPLDEMFKNAFERLDHLEPVDKIKEELGVFTHEWTSKRRGSRYELLDADGDVLNDKLLTKEQAETVVSPIWSEYWTCPPIWEGQTVFILGGGPSLAMMDLSQIHDGRVIGVNDAFVYGDWVDLCFFGDFHWLAAHKEQFRDWPGLKVTNCEDILGTSGILTMKRKTGRGFGEPDELTWGQNSGLAACYLAVKLGASQIVLLGFDMKLSDTGQSNWHPNNLSVNTERTYKGFRYNFQRFEADLKARPGVDVVNCSPDTKMEAFRKATLQEVLEG